MRRSRPSAGRRRSRPRRQRKFLPWLLTILLASVGAWIWWQSARPAKPPPVTQPEPLPPLITAPTAIPTSPPVATIVASLPLPALPVATAAPPVVVTSVPPPEIVRTTPPPPSVEGFPRPPRDLLETQIALARRAISPGSIDGVLGSQTRAALLAFQRRERLPLTGVLDTDTGWALALSSPPFTNYGVTVEDFERLQPVSPSWLGKSQQSVLDYESLLELVAEKSHASPTLVRRLNPGLDWTRLAAGAEIRVPDAVVPEPSAKAGFAVISLGEKCLQVFDGYTNLLAHFPCSIAARVEKRPAGELRVTALAKSPNYTFNPNVFPESAEARELGRKLILPPGPNNPVGTAWVSLSKTGYGIHGTPSPEQVGRTESHGCFRLANWNAEHFLKLAWVGMTIYVEP